VDAHGLVTSMKNGTTTITAVADGVAGGSATVTVQQVAVSIQVTPNAPHFLSLGQTILFSVLGTDARGQPTTAKVVWKSSDASRIRIDSTGLATAVANGAASISATAGAVSGRTAATVASAIIDVTPATATFTSLGDAVRFAATAV